MLFKCTILHRKRFGGKTFLFFDSTFTNQNFKHQNLEETTTNNEKLINILRESVTLFKKYGIRSVSMDDIAREMGISKKTLYCHVNGKTDLVEKILHHSLLIFE